jgi:hypothetical protein
LIKLHKFDALQQQSAYRRDCQFTTVLLHASVFLHDFQLRTLMGKNLNHDNHYYWDHITASHPYGQTAMS